MCGHVGIAGKLEFKDEATIRRLLLFDYLRGPDSTGIAVINKSQSEGKIAKIASHPLDLFDTEKFKKITSGYASSIFMGHNRAATKGGVNAVNTHPYEFGHIIGCHNGTLDSSSFKALEDKIGEKFSVDSQAIFACIEKFGIEETAPLLQGAWALVWYDFQQRSLNFLRNKERSFYIAYTKNFDRIFWASDWHFLDPAIALSAQPYELHLENGFAFFPTEVNAHLRFDMDALLDNTASKMPKPVRKERKGKEPAPVTTTGFGPFPRTTTPNTSGTGSTVSTTTSRGTNARQEHTNTVVSIFGTKNDPFGGMIKDSQLALFNHAGCDWCGSAVDFSDDDGFLIFEKQGIMLCPSCSTNSSSRVYVEDIKPLLASNAA